MTDTESETRLRDERDEKRRASEHLVAPAPQEEPESDDAWQQNPETD